MLGTYKTYDDLASENRTLCTPILCDHTGMEPKDRLRLARERAGYPTASAAAVAIRAINKNTIISNENGNRPISRKMATVYAKAFGVSPGWLLYGEGESPSQPQNGKSIKLSDADTPPVNFFRPRGLAKRDSNKEHRIPLYGQSVAGSYGEFPLNGNKLDEIECPPGLEDIEGLYAVRVYGDSMEPRYFDGETVFVDPNPICRAGDFVIAQVNNGEEAPKAYIKRLVRYTTDELILEQYNPAQKLTFEGRKVVSVHQIIMAGRWR